MWKSGEQSQKVGRVLLLPSSSNPLFFSPFHSLHLNGIYEYSRNVITRKDSFASLHLKNGVSMDIYYLLKYPFPEVTFTEC